MSLSVAVVILNWNGKKWLELFLPTVVDHLPKQAKIYVADNDSKDDSVEFLTKEYPSINIIQLNENLGFAGGYNAALKEVEEDIYVLLNSDIEIKSDWLSPLIQHFEEDSDLACCQPKIIDQKENSRFEYAGASGGYIDYMGFPFCRGRIFNELEEDKGQYNDPTPIFWATGACMLVRKDVFWKAGALDDSYFAHMEEIDLCWRMQRLGYKIMVYPESTVYHVGGGTLQKISPRKTYLNFRNNLTSMIKHLPRKYFYRIIIQKLILDGVAGVKFLVDFQPKHTVAVVRAHFSVYKRLKSIYKERNRLDKIMDEQPIENIYPRSIVFAHFLRGVKTFKELKWKND